MATDWTGHIAREARTYWAARLAAEGSLPCLSCGLDVTLADRWDVGHRVAIADGGDLTDRGNQWPQHRDENRRDGQRIAARRKAESRSEAVFETERATLAPAPPHPSTRPQEPRRLDPDDLPDCVPLHVSAYEPGAGLEELRVGAELLKFEPKPHQELVAAVLASGDHSRYAVEIPRRSGKTTTILAVELGRCLTRPGWIVRFTAQSGIKARAKFMQWCDLLGESDDWHLRRASGAEAILFTNGSRFYVHPPKADAFRSEDTDDAWIDEAQEFDLLASADLLGGIMPTMDTRPGSSLIVSGTTGEVREGMLWASMERLRAGTAGGVEYAVPEDADPDDEATWWRAHPGLAHGLTTVEKVRERWYDLDPVSFGREYLGIWPTTASSALIDVEEFAELEVDPVDPPSDGTPVIAWDSSADGTSAAVFVAWKSSVDDDVVTVREVQVGEGTLWVAAAVDELVRSTRGRAVYDPIGPNVDIAAMLTRLRTPRVVALRGVDLKGGYASIIERVSTGRLRHVQSDALDLAVAEAERRPYGESWLWRRTPHAAALVAATHAAWVAGQTRARARTRLRSTGAA